MFDGGGQKRSAAMVEKPVAEGKVYDGDRSEKIGDGGATSSQRRRFKESGGGGGGKNWPAAGRMSLVMTDLRRSAGGEVEKIRDGR